MKKLKTLRLSKSVLDDREVKAVARVMIKDGYLGMGKEVSIFENELSHFFNNRAVVCVNSGTAALHLALMAVIKPGDEVLVPALTYVASFQAITAAGGVPIACDIDPKTLLVDLNDAAQRLTKKTRVMMPVHYAGGVGDLKALYTFAKKYHLRVIEDAAHAFGTIYEARKVGAFGDITCFSFDGIKNITSGEGGAIVTGDKKVITFVQDARLLGVKKDTQKRYAGERSWTFDVTHQGYRYHLSNIMAAIGRVQLQKFTYFAKKRQSLAINYFKHLKNIESLELIEREYKQVVPHIFPILVTNGYRDKLRQFLKEKGVETGIHYFPNHYLKFFKKDKVSLPVTEKIYTQILSLPLHPALSAVDQQRVIALIKEFFYGL